jgi:hypothetical protein
MIRYSLSSLLFLAVGSMPAFADTPVLVELFATENCGACPTAYETLRTAEAERGDIFVVTWPVDYWDYLGHDDAMALEASKERQMAYVERFGLRGPYTPQTVYDGVTQCAGNKRQRVDASLERLTMDPRRETGVNLYKRDGTIVLEGEASTLMDILLVEYLDDKDEANDTDMVRPVVSVRSIAPWVGGRTEFKADICQTHCALIVQEVGYGPVHAVMDITPAL